MEKFISSSLWRTACSKAQDMNSSWLTACSKAHGITSLWLTACSKAHATSFSLRCSNYDVSIKTTHKRSQNELSSFDIWLMACLRYLCGGFARKPDYRNDLELCWFPLLQVHSSASVSLSKNVVSYLNWQWKMKLLYKHDFEQLPKHFVLRLRA